MGEKRRGKGRQESEFLRILDTCQETKTLYFFGKGDSNLHKPLPPLCPVPPQKKKQEGRGDSNAKRGQKNSSIVAGVGMVPRTCGDFSDVGTGAFLEIETGR